MFLWKRSRLASYDRSMRARMFPFPLCLMAIDTQPAAWMSSKQTLRSNSNCALSFNVIFKVLRQRCKLHRLSRLVAEQVEDRWVRPGRG